MHQRAKLLRQKVNLAAREYRADPFRAFGELRAMGPVVPASVSVMGNVWLLTSYQSVMDGLKDDGTFCRDPKTADRSDLWFLKFMGMFAPRMMKMFMNNMIGKDGQDHRRLRSLVDQAFQRQQIEEMRDRAITLTDTELDRVAEIAKKNAAGQGEGQVDLIEHLARSVPLAMICELLGLPDSDRPKFRQWFSSFANIGSFWSFGKIFPGLRKTVKYLRQQFDEVRKNPREGLISALVQAEDSGDRLNDEELMSMVLLLLIAGHETTVHLLSCGILTLLQLPDVKRSLLADWSQVDDAVEEMMRFNSPAQFAKPRYVTRDVEFHGQSLKKGELVLPVIAAANFDPDRFDRPDEFIIGRDRNYHLGFGAGPHVCLGLKLARLETAVVLERLFTRWPDLSAAFDLNNPDWSTRMGMRSLRTLPVVGL